MTKNYDKRKIIILRAVLVLFGGAMGALAMWQYFVYFPDFVQREYRIAIIVVSTVVFATLMGLSAGPLYRLWTSVYEILSSGAARLGRKGIAAVALGLVSAAALTFAFDAVVSRVQNIWAVRLLLDIIFAILAAALLCFAFTKYLNMQGDGSEEAAPRKRNGYLISSECFTDERVLTAVRVLDGAAVIDGAYKALSFTDCVGDAVQRLNAATDGGVAVIRCKRAFDDAEGCALAEKEIADRRSLRLVRLRFDGSDPDAIGLDAFAPPSGE